MDNRRNNLAIRTTTTLGAAVFSLLLLLPFVTTTTVYAQVPTQTTPAAPEAKAILDATTAACAQKGVPQCMSVDYQSATFIALHGDSLLPSGATYYPNFYLWETVDKLQTTLGFRVISMATSGAGTEPNPTILHVVLSK